MGLTQAPYQQVRYQNKMDEINKDLSEAVTERVKSPFIASFILSWAVINWKFFAILLLGNIEISKRISEADATLNISSLYLSLAISTLYTFAWPWVTHLIVTYQAGIKFMRTKESVNEEHQIELQKTKHNLAKIRYETKEQHAIDKLLKARGLLTKSLNNQRELTKDVDELLSVAEDRASKVSHFQSMLSMFQRNYDEFDKFVIKNEESSNE